MITTPPKFLSFAYLCKDMMSEFCFYLSITTRAKSCTYLVYGHTTDQHFFLTKPTEPQLNCSDNFVLNRQVAAQYPPLIVPKICC